MAPNERAYYSVQYIVLRQIITPLLYLMASYICSINIGEHHYVNATRHASFNQRQGRHNLYNLEFSDRTATSPKGSPTHTILRVFLPKIIKVTW